MLPKIKTPKFWYPKPNAKPTILEHLLSPLGHLYHLAHIINYNITTPHKVDIPVICIGNITAGGSGKTPASIAIQQIIVESNLKQSPYFLTRGYSGSETLARCITVHDDPKCTGDEPLILAKHNKTVVSRQRHKGACIAKETGADCIIMDDGFQNNTLKKDISFLVINGAMGLGNQRLLPSGPLREPLSAALKRTDAVIFIDSDQHNILNKIPKDIPVFKSSIHPCTLNTPKKDCHYIAFSGLAHNEKFHNTLKDNTFNIIEFHNFADHYQYKNHDIEKLLEKASKQSANLITTEKDYIRIPEKYKKHITTLEITLKWEDQFALEAFLKDALNAFNP